MNDKDTFSGSFRSLFFAVGNPKDFSPSAWERFFVPFDRKKWNEDTAGGLVFELANGEQFSLIIEYHPELGLTLAYETDSVEDDDFPSDSWISVNDPTAMSDFVILENGSQHARGSFLDASRAWEVVEAFLDDPTKIPVQINWLNADDLDWPEPP